MTKEDFEKIREILKELQITLDKCNQNAMSNDKNSCKATTDLITQILELIKQLINQDESIELH